MLHPMLLLLELLHGHAKSQQHHAAQLGRTRLTLLRYKHEIRKEDKEALRKLIKVQYHYQVSPEITRELDASRCELLCCNMYCALLIAGPCICVSISPREA